MTQLSPPPTELSQQESPFSHSKTVLLGGVIGNVIEWYDFALFGYFAPVISSLFFPHENATISLLETYGVFAAGFIMRPLGGISLGLIGDKVGRRTELFLSLSLMSVATFLLGMLPDYEHIGIAAPLALISLRLLQGLSAGGEFTGSVTYVAETAPQEQRGLMSSFTNVGSMAGMLLGLGMVTLMTSMVDISTLEHWGWRVPFWFGGLLGLAGFYIRQNIPASTVFQKTQEETSSLSFLGALRQDAIPMGQATFYAAGYTALFYILLVYLPTYLEQFTPMALNRALLLNTVVIAVLLPVMPLMAWLSDWVLRRKVWLLIALIGLGLLSYPAFWLFQQGNPLWVWLIQLGFAGLLGSLLGISPAMMVELFSTETRLTAYSVAFNAGACIGGGISPLVVTGLIEKTGSVYAPAWYLAGMAAIATLALGGMRDRSREPLRSH